MVNASWESGTAPRIWTTTAPRFNFSGPSGFTIFGFTTWIYYRITNSEDFTCEKRRFKEQKLDVWPAQKRDMLWLFATVNKSTGTWYSTGESATVQHVTNFHFLGYNWDDYPSCLERLLRLCNSDVWCNPSWRLFVPEGCMSMYLYNFIHAYIYIYHIYIYVYTDLYIDINQYKSYIYIYIFNCLDKLRCDLMARRPWKDFCLWGNSPLERVFIWAAWCSAWWNMKFDLHKIENEMIWYDWNWNEMNDLH